MFKFKLYFHDSVVRKFSLARAIRSAIALNNAAAVRALLATHGESAVALALSELPGSSIVDALSVLASGDRPGVQARLTPLARRRLDAFLDVIDHARPTEGPRGHSVLVWTRPM